LTLSRYRGHILYKENTFYFERTQWLDGLYGENTLVDPHWDVFTPEQGKALEEFRV
jgi:hypothetical protein